MRRYLLAMILWVGTGAAMGQNSAGVVTYHAAADGLIEAYEEAPQGFWDLLAMFYEAGNYNVTPHLPVEFTQGTEPVYSGVMTHPLGGDFIRNVVEAFYEVACASPDKYDCGRLRVGPNPQGVPVKEAATGTGLDAFVTHMNIGPSWEWPDCGASCGSTPPAVEFFCDNGHGRKEYGSGYSYAVIDGVGRHYFVGWVNEGGGWSKQTVQNTPEYSPPDWITPEQMNLQCPVPTLVNWKSGVYWQRMGTPEAHPDTYEGVKIAVQELVGEVSRTTWPGAPMEVLTGSAWNPEPTAAQLATDDVPIGPPGEPGETVIDPGDCTSGWILTRVVCVIREQGDRLWTFLSHDAWVPTGDYEARAVANRDARVGKFPLGLPNHWANFFGSTEHWDSTILACPTVDFSFQMPFIDPEVTQAAEYTLCDNAIADWLHQFFRPAMYYIFLLSAMWGLMRAAGVHA